MLSQSVKLSRLVSRISFVVCGVSVLTGIVSLLDPNSLAYIAGKQQNIAYLFFFVALLQVVLALSAVLRLRAQQRINYQPSMSRGIVGTALAFACLALDYLLVNSFYGAAFGGVVSPVGSAEVFGRYAVFGLIYSLITLVLGFVHGAAAILSLREDVAALESKE